jgi:hypothetical protein
MNNAGVVAVNSKVVGLAPAVDVVVIILTNLQPKIGEFLKNQCCGHFWA